jgi:hypothetical protein
MTPAREVCHESCLRNDARSVQRRLPAMKKEAAALIAGLVFAEQ